VSEETDVFGGVPSNGVPLDAVPAVQGIDVSYGGVPYVSWSGADDTQVTGIPASEVTPLVETVDEALVEALKGVDIQVHGLDNKPQPSVADAAVSVDPVTDEAVSQETVDVPEVEVPEVEPEVVDEVVSPEVPAKRGPGRPRKNG
jgi:hypothetical protein